jgi:hypothetical protein
MKSWILSRGQSFGDPHGLKGLGQASIGLYLGLSDYPFTFLCHRIEVATTRLQHTRTYQLINGIEHVQSPFGLVPCCLEEDMQVQAILAHFPE